VASNIIKSDIGKDKKNNASGKLKNLIKNNIPNFHFVIPDKALQILISEEIYESLIK
jgi:hypothetical protein